MSCSHSKVVHRHDVMNCQKELLGTCSRYDPLLQGSGLQSLAVYAGSSILGWVCLSFHSSIDNFKLMLQAG